MQGKMGTTIRRKLLCSDSFENIRPTSALLSHDSEKTIAPRAQWQAKSKPHHGDTSHGDISQAEQQLKQTTEVTKEHEGEPVPAGTGESSPARQCWVGALNMPSPVRDGRISSQQKKNFIDSCVE